MDIVDLTNAHRFSSAYRLGKFLQSYKPGDIIEGTEFEKRLSMATAGYRYNLRRNIFLLVQWGWVDKTDKGFMIKTIPKMPPQKFDD